jgi:hypothetical protein
MQRGRQLRLVLSRSGEKFESSRFRRSDWSRALSDREGPAGVAFFYAAPGLNHLVGVWSAVAKAVREWQLIIWIGSFAGQIRRVAKQAPSGSANALIGSGMYSGMLDAAEDLGLGAWSLARKWYPAPPAAPTADNDVHVYLTGYFQGHATVTLAWQRWTSGKPYGGPGISDQVMGYTAVLASPEVQGVLAVPGEASVMKAHQFACLMAKKHGRPIPDLQTEVGLYRWLAGRSSVAVPANLEQRLDRLRQRRDELIA